jgi:hypothetical protein
MRKTVSENEAALPDHLGSEAPSEGIEELIRTELKTVEGRKHGA